MSQGVELIAAERQRQQDREGFNRTGDLAYRPGTLAMAASCYASEAYKHINDKRTRVPRRWPWIGRWWKPKDPVRDLVRAGALIAAELDRHIAQRQIDASKDKGGDAA